MTGSNVKNKSRILTKIVITKQIPQKESWKGPFLGYLCEKVKNESVNEDQDKFDDIIIKNPHSSNNMQTRSMTN